MFYYDCFHDWLTSGIIVNMQKIKVIGQIRYVESHCSALGFLLQQQTAQTIVEMDVEGRRLRLLLSACSKLSGNCVYINRKDVVDRIGINKRRTSFVITGIRVGRNNNR